MATSNHNSRTGFRGPGFSAAILAGGASARMGENKALMMLGDKPVISHVIDSLAPVTGDIFIVSSDVAGYEAFGLPVCADHYQERASLVGIYSALAAARRQYCFTIACDMPFVEPALVRELARLAPGYDAVVPVSRRGWEPLHAVYSRDCLIPFRERIERGEFSVRQALDTLKVRYVEAAAMEAFCDPNMVFLNVNTGVDLEEASLLIPGVRKKKAGAGTAAIPAGRPPLICFVGTKNSGKTTFIEKLIPALKGRGVDVACVKHDVHRFRMDHEGTDTWRFSKAGAKTVIISSPEAVARLENVGQERSLEDLYAAVSSGVDLVIVEGYKRAVADKIEISRSAVSDSLACREEELIAVISDHPDAAGSVPVFGLDDVEAVANLVMIRYGLGDGGAGLDQGRS